MHLIIVMLYNKNTDCLQVSVCLENDPLNCGNCELCVTTPTFGEWIGKMEGNETYKLTSMPNFLSNLRCMNAKLNHIFISPFSTKSDRTD